MGEIFWAKEPTDEAIQAMGTQRGEWAEGLDEILSWFEDAGARLVEMIIASKEDRDRYEGLTWRTFDRWMREHPDDPEFDQIAAFAQDCQHNYLKSERRLCDWGIFVLRLTG